MIRHCSTLLAGPHYAHAHRTPGPCSSFCCGPCCMPDSDSTRIDWFGFGCTHLQFCREREFTSRCGTCYCLRTSARGRTSRTPVLFTMTQFGHRFFRFQFVFRLCLLCRADGLRGCVAPSPLHRYRTTAAPHPLIIADVHHTTTQISARCRTYLYLNLMYVAIFSGRVCVRLLAQVVALRWLHVFACSFWDAFLLHLLLRATIHRQFTNSN